MAAAASAALMAIVAHAADRTVWPDPSLLDAIQFTRKPE